MEFIHLAKSVKRDVEKVSCYSCERGHFTFKRMQIKEDFILEEGGYATVDTYCKSCNTSSTISIKLIPTDEYSE